MVELEQTWLIQRLNKPYPRKDSIGEIFSFGGGLKNGGLSDNAMALLRPIFSFEYMGAAEFDYLYCVAMSKYCAEFDRDTARPILYMTQSEINEYCEIHARGYSIWKKEQSRNH